MVTIWPMLFIILRIRSLALTPIASERLRTVIGGSISAWRLAGGGDGEPLAAACATCGRRGRGGRPRRLARAGPRRARAR